ncbi:Transcription elongation factor A protein 2 [Myotis brandtii]|uniref:Transcription elongation factor A protein 2 n=1 Tax=Myotis brandtii TaxID=109478 RepID=S7QEX4_MYOBR|nr:Transcription elongation factor A protein 2 [Myotis brandtii]
MWVAFCAPSGACLLGTSSGFDVSTSLVIRVLLTVPRCASHDCYVTPKPVLWALLLALLGTALPAQPRACSVPDVLRHYQAVIFEDLQAAARRAGPGDAGDGPGSRHLHFVQKNQTDAVAPGRRSRVGPSCGDQKEGAVDLLRELKAMPVTLHLLQSTRVGMSVNALRKQSSDEEVIALAKSLIKSWKKLLGSHPARGEGRGRREKGPRVRKRREEEGGGREEGGHCPSEGLGQPPPGDRRGAASGPRAPPASALCPSPQSAGLCPGPPSGPAWPGGGGQRLELPRVLPAPRMTTFPPMPVTCDAVRNKCREMLTAALQTDREHTAISADCERLSAQIEEYILCAGA